MRRLENKQRLAPVADPDFADEVVDELYRYRHKRNGTAFTLCLFTGCLGGHRFYLGQIWLGTLYFLTAGGVLILWLRDLTQTRELVSAYNAIEDERKAAGLAPQSLSFLPAKESLDLKAPPPWAKRRHQKSVLVGGFLLLAVIGLAMGAIAGSTGIREPSIILIVFMVTTLLAARWPGMRNIPLLAQLSRWNHRLRLYYFTTDPGSVWLLAARPYVGVFIAPWRQQSRAEVRLYLQLGIAFAILFAALDIYEARNSGFWVGFGLAVAEIAQTIVYTYVFIAPVGAILLTQQLLARTDWMILGMCAVNLTFGYLGLFIVGAV